jgi:predicted small secreted protein
MEALMKSMMLAATIALCGTALAGCANTPGNGGATGASSDAYVGGRANAGATANGSTQSASILEQRIKQDSAQGAQSGGRDTRY